MANCRERRDPDPGAKSRDAPSHDEGPGTQDAREHRPRPAARRGRQGHGQARPRAREARDALSLPQLTAGPRGPRPRRVPGRQAPEGRPDAGRVWRRLGAHPREGEALPAVCPGPPRARVHARARLPAGPGRGLLSGTARRMLRGIRISSGDEPGGPASPRKASAEPVVHGRGRDLSDTGPTTEELVIDTLLSDGADEAR